MTTGPNQDGRETAEVRHWQRYWSTLSGPTHRWRDPAMMLRLAQEQLWHLDGGDRLLDIGCGSGLVLRHLEPAFSRCIACDPSPAMLADARTTVATASLVQADDVSIWPLLDGFHPDRISSSDLVQYLPPGRLAKLLQTAAIHLAPGGRIGLFGIIDPRLYPLFVDGRLAPGPVGWLERLTKRARYRLGGLRRRLSGLPADPLGWAYAPWQIAPMAEAAGFDALFPRSAWYEYRYHAILTRRA